MEIGSAGPSVSALAAQATAQSAARTQDAVGLAMVKKTMDNQQLVADKLLSMLQPKGQVIDIRA
ncbi:MAG: YjfB family protein, partial [Armatimonadota bacterium]